MISGVIADFSSAKMFRVNKSASEYVSPEHIKLCECSARNISAFANTFRAASKLEQLAQGLSLIIIYVHHLAISYCKSA